MATISNNINNSFENINLKCKINKLEDSKFDHYVFRKQIDYSLANCYIPNLSNLKQIPSKSQQEELQKLQSEISHVEEKIRELEMAKKMKLNKVEDLRCVIERIADEDCFDCVFTSRINNNKSLPRERNYSLNSNKKPKSSIDISRTTNFRNSDETTTNQVDTIEEGIPQGEDSEGAGAKGCIICNCNSICSCSHCHSQQRLLREDCLQQMAYYWQENLSAPRKIFKD